MNGVLAWCLKTRFKDSSKKRDDSSSDDNLQTYSVWTDPEENQDQNELLLTLLKIPRSNYTDGPIFFQRACMSRHIKDAAHTLSCNFKFPLPIITEEEENEIKMYVFTVG